MCNKIFGFYGLLLLVQLKFSQEFIDESKTEVKVGKKNKDLKKYWKLVK